MLITELGYFALLTAFVLALLQVILPTIGVIRNQVVWQRLAPSLAWAQFAAMITSFGALIAGFIIMILASVTSRSIPIRCCLGTINYRRHGADTRALCCYG